MTRIVIAEATIASTDATSSPSASSFSRGASRGRRPEPIHIAASQPAKPRTLFWSARRADRTWKAVRDGNLKYVSRKDDSGFEEYVFDLSKDPGEGNNLIEMLPAATAKLKRQLTEWEQDVR